jgi:ERCC4-type nuclease
MTNEHNKKKKSSILQNGVFPIPVIVDTREQRPFLFQNIAADKQDGGGQVLIQIERGTLKAGDYSLSNHELKIAIERKSKSDLFGTLGGGRKRFEAELARLMTYHVAAVVVESEWGEILTNPPSRTRMEPKTVFRSVLAWQQRFQTVHWWFMPDRHAAEVTTYRILERYVKELAI